jgi:putative transposase
MCDTLGVSRSGFHAWLTRPQSARARKDEKLGAVVHASLVRSDRTYGARRIWHDVLAEGFNCGLHGIGRLMRMNALRARPRRRQLRKDQGERSIIAPNVLEREFVADVPNQKWVADFTYIWTAEGWLYVAVVIVPFSRRIVGCTHLFHTLPFTPPTDFHFQKTSEIEESLSIAVIHIFPSGI